MSRKFCSERTIRLPYAAQRTTDPEDAAKKKFKFQKNIQSSEKISNSEFQANKKKT
jgi:hypothetical protein